MSDNKHKLASQLTAKTKIALEKGQAIIKKVHTIKSNLPNIGHVTILDLEYSSGPLNGTALTVPVMSNDYVEVVPKVTKKSWFDRIKSFFGFGKK